jgi:hypothetical protein
MIYNKALMLRGEYSLKTNHLTMQGKTQELIISSIEMQIKDGGLCMISFSVKMAKKIFKKHLKVSMNSVIMNKWLIRLSLKDLSPH